jgi:hypothetical protein
VLADASRVRALAAILWGGLIAGTLDLIYACVHGLLAGRPALRTLQSVASGLLGRGAFQGGWNSAWLGLVLHFVIALGAATAYFTASRRMRLLIKRAWLAGPLFGALVYLFMNNVVVPLSAAPFRIRNEVTGLLVHMFFIGLPMALSARRYSQ